MLRRFHDQNGHLGVEPTLRVIRSRFFWPGLRDSVQTHIRHCSACIRSKVPTHGAGATQIKDRGRHPGDVWSMDVYEVGLDADGYTHILVFVCDFSTWVRFVPLKGPGTASSLRAIFKHEILRNESCPRVVYSDQGSNLIKEFWDDFATLHGFEKVAGAAHLKNTSGKAERTIRSLKQMLQTHRIATRNQRWHAVVADHEMACNFNGKAFYLARLRDPSYPWDIAMYGLDALRARVQQPSEWLQQAAKDVASVWDAHYEVTRAHAVKAAARLDRGRDLNLVYRVGDRVLLLRHDRKGKWCNPYYDEPYRILRADAHGNYELGDRHNRRASSWVPSAFLKPYHEQTNDGD